MLLLIIKKQKEKKDNQKKKALALLSILYVSVCLNIYRRELKIKIYTIMWWNSLIELIYKYIYF